MSVALCKNSSFSLSLRVCMMQTKSPTVEAGVSEEAEMGNRIFGCELINQAGVMLKL